MAYIIVTFEIMVSHFWSGLCRAAFVFSEILALLSSTCLWTWMPLNINTEVLVMGHKLLWVSHGVGGQLHCCVQLVL